MSRPRNRRAWRRWLPGAAGLLVAALAAGLVARSLSRRAPPPTPPPSPYRNTSAAHYVGADACRSCHEGRHATFRSTGMGRSMAEVDPAHEPPDAAFDHAPSGRRYQIRRRDGRLWHREILLTPEPEEVVLAEYPVRYVVGSGRHSRSYLAEAEGFLVESPVTWYTARQAWGMSPGYTGPDQLGFERAAGTGCLSCHAGRAEAIDRSLHRMHLTEAAISCERCHGPGSLHVARHTGPRPSDAAPQADFTIVNPARLPRELAEAVCQQCHLRSSATVVSRGKKLGDFRPGLPRQDFWEDYQLEAPDTPMTVVGHVEQLHRSRCYRASDTLTCLTCHSPHSEPSAEERVAHYRSVCLECHRPERCTVEASRRQRESPDNDCVHCHMPRAPTEVPHLAFTHHRIQVPGRQPAVTPAARAPAGGATLRPFLNLARLSDGERARSLGLGYLEVANRESDPRRRARYQEQALELMTGAWSAGLQDGALNVSLARLRFDMEREPVLPFAAAALEDPGLIGQDRCNALFLCADALAARGRHAEAAAALRELTGLRRHAIDWLLLADCAKALGDQAGSVEALRAAVRINPRLAKAQRFLAEYYDRQGDRERAAWHRRRARSGPPG